MQKLMKMLEDMMVAVTFAEAGEYDEARKMSSPDRTEDAYAADQLKAREA